MKKSLSDKPLNEALREVKAEDATEAQATKRPNAHGEVAHRETPVKDNHNGQAVASETMKAANVTEHRLRGQTRDWLHRLFAVAFEMDITKFIKWMRRQPEFRGRQPKHEPGRLYHGDAAMMASALSDASIVFDEVMARWHRTATPFQTDREMALHLLDMAFDLDEEHLIEHIGQVFRHDDPEKNATNERGATWLGRAFSHSSRICEGVIWSMVESAKQEETEHRAEPAFVVIRDKAPTLKEAQEAVDGWIERIDLPNGNTLVVNEEGQLEGLPVNVAATEYARKAGLPLELAAVRGEIVGNAIALEGRALSQWKRRR